MLKNNSTEAAPAKPCWRVSVVAAGRGSGGQAVAVVPQGAIGITLDEPTFGIEMHGYLRVLQDCQG